MPRYNPKSKIENLKWRGFTLIELLVVVAIIAVLVAMLLPALVKARESARQVVCQSDAKQVTISLMMYTQEGNDYLPPGWYNQQLYINWAVLISKYTGVDVTNQSEKNLLLCPSDDTPKATVDNSFALPGQNGPKISYAANSAVMDDTGYDQDGDGHLGGRKVSTIADPSRLILLAEYFSIDNILGGSYSKIKCGTYYYWIAYTMQNVIDQDPAKIGYHNLKNNWFFIDGHAAYMNWIKTVDPNNSLYPILWNYTK